MIRSCSKPHKFLYMLLSVLFVIDCHCKQSLETVGIDDKLFSYRCYTEVSDINDDQLLLHQTIANTHSVTKHLLYSVILSK